MKKFSINKYLLGLIFIATICIAAYSNCIGNEFLLDDYTYLISDEGVGSRSVASLILEGCSGFYRPVQMLVLKLSLYCFGPHPEGFHILNLVLFIAVCLLFFYLILYLFRDYWLALLSCSLFAVHPINNFQVNYCTASGLSIYVLCMQMSIILFLKFLDRQKRVYYLGSLGFYFLGLLTHPASFVTPIYLFLILYFVRKSGAKRQYLYLLIYFLIFILFLIIQSHIKGLRTFAPVFQLAISPGSYIATIAQLISWYFSKLIFPWDILFIWHILIADKHIFFWDILVFTVIAGLVYLFKKMKKGHLAFGLTLFLAGFLHLGISSFSYIFITGFAVIETHWFYFSSIGFFILMAGLLLALRRGVFKTYWFILPVFLIIILTGLTRCQNPLWKDQGTYCVFWIKTNPLNFTPWKILAKSYKKTNKIDQLKLILAGFDNLLASKQDYFLYFRRGNAYVYINELVLAVADYTKALELKPFDSLIYNNRGVIYEKSGQNDLALNDYNRAIMLNSQESTFYKNRSNLLLKIGNYEQAAQDFAKSRILSAQETQGKKNGNNDRKLEF